MKYSGEITNFSREAVEKILERQVEQANKKDVNVFEKKYSIFSRN